jgi:hypothetical protein
LFLEFKKEGEQLSGGQARMLAALDRQPQNTVAAVYTRLTAVQEEQRWLPVRVLFFDPALSSIDNPACIGWLMRAWVAYARQTGRCFFRDHFRKSQGRLV